MQHYIFLCAPLLNVFKDPSNQNCPSCCPLALGVALMSPLLPINFLFINYTGLYSSHIFYSLSVYINININIICIYKYKLFWHINEKLFFANLLDDFKNYKMLWSKIFLYYELEYFRKKSEILVLVVIINLFGYVIHTTWVFLPYIISQSGMVTILVNFNFTVFIIYNAFGMHF